jgi:hypothetical protein
MSRLPTVRYANEWVGMVKGQYPLNVKVAEQNWQDLNVQLIQDSL